MFGLNGPLYIISSSLPLLWNAGDCKDSGLCNDYFGANHRSAADLNRAGRMEAANSALPLPHPFIMSKPELSPDTFKVLLKKLHAAPSDFTANDVALAMDHLLAEPLAATPTQIGAFLSGLKLTGIEHLPSTLATASDALLQRAIVPSVSGGDDVVRADMVGTGGDGHNVFNVSTTAAIVAAGAGLRIIKVIHVQTRL